MIIGVLISLLLFVLGVAIKYFNWDWLIAGYNTMSKERKGDINIEGLRKFMGNNLFILASLLLIAFIFDYLGNGITSIIMFGFFIIYIIYMVIRAQKYDLNKKEITKTSLLILIFIILVSSFSIGLVIYGTLPNHIEVNSEYIKISGTYGMDISIDSIENVQMIDNIPDIKGKVNGFDAGNIRKGTFNLEEIGKGRIYIEKNEGPFIYLITAEDYIIINYKDEGITKQIYNDILSNLEK